MRDETLLAMLAVFVPFSLLSIGGGSAIIAAIQHEAVVIRGWVTGREFIDLFAVSREAPGSGTMLATLIGWKVAGWAGAVVATLALYVPSSSLAFAVVPLTSVHRGKRWYAVARDGLAPIGTGLVLAGVIALFRLSDGGLLAIAIAAAPTGLFLATDRVPVLVVLASGGLCAAAAASLL